MFLHGLDVVGLLMKWFLALNELYILYKLHTALKSQVLAKFVAKFMTIKLNEEIT